MSAVHGGCQLQCLTFIRSFLLRAFCCIRISSGSMLPPITIHHGAATYTAPSHQTHQHPLRGLLLRRMRSSVQSSQPLATLQTSCTSMMGRSALPIHSGHGCAVLAIVTQTMTLLIISATGAEADAGPPVPPVGEAHLCQS